jgi:hypothetical protein
MVGRIAIGIVVHNPGEKLLERLERCTNAGYSFYIFDNSPDYSAVRTYAKTTTAIKYYTCGSNAGLGYGISAVCAQAYYDGYPALLFFDQDTGFTPETLEFVEQVFAQKEASLSGYSAILFNSRSHGMQKTREVAELPNVVLAINSGSLYVLENLKTVNWHDHGYFVDGVDYKFCLDSAKNNLKIGECSWTPGFDHVTEQDGKVYSIFGRTCRLRAYSWFRVKDTVTSSLKLIGSALSSFQFKIAAKVIRLFVIYVLSQMLARGVDFVWGRKHV